MATTGLEKLSECHKTTQGAPLNFSESERNLLFNVVIKLQGDVRLQIMWINIVSLDKVEYKRPSSETSCDGAIDKAF